MNKFQKLMKKFADETNQRNEAYAKMSPMEKRVAIAKDTLALVKAGGLAVDTGAYCNWEPDGYKELDMVESDSMRDFIFEHKEALPGCTVCAKGGLFIGKILGYNQITYGQTGNGYSSHLELDDPSSLLLDAFDRETLNNIENAFEKTMVESGDVKAPYMYWGIYDPQIRLIKICENIIRNNGEFKIRLTGDGLAQYKYEYGV